MLMDVVMSLCLFMFMLYVCVCFEDMLASVRYELSLCYVCGVVQCVCFACFFVCCVPVCVMLRLCCAP